MGRPLRFGVFLAPFHSPTRNPTLALHRDLELIQHLDVLGYDEAWIGEHHSAGFEIIASPEVFIATAAERTRRIRLGTGVSSLPFHHPFLLADRMVLLDHLTRGRVMLGVGPGALPSDAFMLGIDTDRQRAMMEEALEAIVVLLTTDEPVTRSTDWFTLRDARLQLRPFQYPCFDIAVAATISPAGPRAAGRFGLGLLSLGATTRRGFDVLEAHWRVMSERAAQFGTTADRSHWRLVAPLHLADTESQARRDVEFGLSEWVEYFRKVAPLPLAPDATETGDLVDAMNASDFAVIGTPDMAVAQIRSLMERSGGFGAYLCMAHDWADRDATLRSFELLAREVMPVFQGSTVRAVQSRDWAAANREAFVGAATTAVLKAVQHHYAERSSHGEPSSDRPTGPSRG